MTYLKSKLPSLEIMKEDFEKNGLELFIKNYSKCDFFLGSVESIDFLNEKFDEYKLLKK